MKNVKTLSFTLLFVINTFGLSGQVGVNTLLPDTATILDIRSSNKGILIPRIKEDGLYKTPPAGVLYYNTAEQKFKYKDSLNGIRRVNPLNEDAIGNLTAPKQLIVTGNLTVSAPSTVVGYGTIPIGGIIMWSGIGDPGDGWALCDGTIANGYQTPDLRGRFIVGFANDWADHGKGAVPADIQDNNYLAKTNTGGEKKHLLTDAESALPKHAHDITPNPHNHANGVYDKLLRVRDDSDYTVGDIDKTAGEPGLDAVLPLKDVTLTIAPQGKTTADVAHENRPPYYVLAFIMRVR